MGLFKKEPIFPDPKPTRLSEGWFTSWARETAGKVGPGSAQNWPNEADAIAWMVEKANGVIDHDFRDYVQRYCSQPALKRYVTFYSSAQLTPWDLISVTATLQPDKLSEWENFLVEDAEEKLNRFAEIIVDPSTVE